MLKNFSVSRKSVMCSFAFVFLLFCGGFINIAFAQTALPNGGSGFTQATAISAGTYQGTIAPNSDFYYKVEVGTGKEMDTNVSFGMSGGGENTYSAGNLYLYKGDKEEFDNTYGAGGALVSWLSKSNQTLYVRMVNDTSEDTLTYNLGIVIQNRFDAGSQTDAGDTIDGALTIAPGSYNGYLSGVSVMQTPYGDDFKDYYKIAVLKGKNYEFKLTPPSEGEGQLELFNANRESIDENSSANTGAVASISLTPTSDTNVFLSVGSGYFNGVVAYKLDVISPDASVKFYTCKNNTTCESAGNYSSLQACQAATAKNCYSASDCDSKCGDEDPLPPPDNPICQNECNFGQTKCFDNFNYYKCDDYNKDGCFEWASPVYCGQGNKCDNGKCKSGPGGCQCSEWQGGAKCGADGCVSGSAAKTRVCVPAACDSEKTCIADPSCQVTPVFGMGWLSFLKGFGFLALFSGLYLLLLLAAYIYMALCLQVIAKKTDTKNGWMAWIPIANIFLMINIARKPLWWFLLILIPLVNIVIAVILWMEIAKRRGKPNWVGILIIVPFVGIVIPGYLAFSGDKKEPSSGGAPYIPTDTVKEADKPTAGDKYPCKYCGKSVPPNSTTCPFCEKVNPLGPYRCPKCHEPIEKEWKICPKCNQNLRIVCPFCKKITFFGDHCEDCGKRLLVKCPNCGQEQPPIADNCIKCGKPIEPKDK